jgi:putative PIN family toxin of toxin-antitoxin system
VRIVFDTNVLLSGLLTRGLCEAILDTCLGGKEHAVFLSEHILREFERHAVGKVGAPPEMAHLAVEFLRSQVEIVQPDEVPSNACRDPADLAVLGTALAARADCLVTGDKDLLDLREFRGIPILSPRAIHGRLA